MGYPFILYDNVFGDYSGTLSTHNASTETGFSVDNVNDWRSFTLWKESTTGFEFVGVKVDLGASTTRDADTFIVYNHNTFSSGSGTIELEAAWSTDDVSYTTASVLTVTDDKIAVGTFTAPGAKRYWRVISQRSTRSAKQYFGIVCLGLRLDFTEGFPGDPYQRTVVQDAPVSESGNFLGADVGSVIVAQDIDFGQSPAGILSTWFTTPASGKDDVDGDDWLESHAEAGKPYFFGWNVDNLTSRDVRLSRIAPNTPIDQGFIGTTARRRLRFRQLAIQET